MSTIDLAASSNDLRTLAEQSNAWPFEQAKAIVARLKKQPKDEVLFETGYGPPDCRISAPSAKSRAPPWCATCSACSLRTGSSTIAGDFRRHGRAAQGARQCAEQGDAGAKWKAATRVPHSFGPHPSFGAHNNARLRAFLDAFGFDYESASSTDYYTSGKSMRPCCWRWSALSRLWPSCSPACARNAHPCSHRSY